MPSPSSLPIAEGDLLVRLRVTGRDAPAWANGLPGVPDGALLTVTLGHPGLADVTLELLARGYRVVGVADEQHAIGPLVDILVPQRTREADPAWWQALLPLAERVFDLRHGPVRMVLAPELERHTHPLAG